MIAENTLEMIGITRWTKEEEQYLIENSEKPLKEIAETLHRSVQSLKDKRRLLGLKKEKINNLQGKRFGRLLVLRENGRRGRRVAWLCRCDCGEEKTISSTHLIQGDTVSCGCYSREISSETNSNNLSGQRFNHLLAIKKSGKSNTLNTWLCLCDCGKYTIVISKNLIRGNTESCGCRRNINQRKGMKWELLLKNVLKYKFPDFLYHKRLQNNSVPDFTIETLNIILDAKRHDYLKIEECIDKYLPFCKKLIFICMEKKRKNWKKDLKDNRDIEFWYPEDLLSWIPNEEKNSFLNTFKEIKNLWIKEKEMMKEIKIEKTIQELKEEEKTITQKTIAKKLGVSKKTLRKNSNVVSYLENYRKNQKELEETQTIESMKKVIDDKIKNGQRIMVMDIAKMILKSQNNKDKEILDREIWKLTKKLSTNKIYIEYIKNSQNKLEESRKKIIEKVVEELKIQDQNITILKVQLLTGLPKNYLYSEEIENYIENLK